MMKRHLMGLALGALVGSFVLGGSAQACHKKKACAAPTPVCAAPVVETCAPAPVVETCAPAPKKHCFKLPTMKLPKLGCGGFKLHGHKAAPATCAPAAEVAYSAPVYEAAPVYAAPQQILAAPQATGQN
ncbi:hypothetical protein [Paludisphaera mucosa]|uniref:Uncharacterized protein n=1 Tax=Paludisphaera mucosa TaxID=3030827 RepID=A0ABT6F9X2_9BACT|nr:hypothetical protein [Paludisphaera mucosa]MDG3004234.1 hypothetical protein [Paludisphaera mucosa]